MANQSWPGRPFDPGGSPLISVGTVSLRRVAQDGMRASAGSASFRGKKGLKRSLKEARKQVKRLAQEREHPDPEATNRERAARERAAREREERVREAPSLADGPGEEGAATSDQVEGPTGESDQGAGVHHGPPGKGDEDAGWGVPSRLQRGTGHGRRPRGHSGSGGHHSGYGRGAGGPYGGAGGGKDFIGVPIPISWTEALPPGKTSPFWSTGV